MLRSGRLDTESVSRILQAAWHAAGADSPEAVRDLNGIIRDTAANLEAGTPVLGEPSVEESAPGVVKLLCRWWGWRDFDDRDADDQDVGGKRKGPTQAELLLQYAENVELFHSPDGTGYASIGVSDHRENHPVRGRSFRRWLLARYYSETGSSPSAQAVTDALGVVEARALFGGPERPVHLRVAGYEGSVYLDLCNSAWEAVEVTPDGWRVVSSHELPVRFLRRENAAPLPNPASTGDLAPLRGLLNVRGEEDWRLILGWLVGALQPDGSYPVLDLEGEQGSAKSTTARVLRSIVDPAVEPLRAPPREARDLAIAAMGNWTVTLDNLSGLRGWLSDALCRLATGGGFATRSLYTDDEEVIFSAKRPVILTGIDSIATAGDLRDRAIILQLPSIPADTRRTEREFVANLDAIRPTVLAGLLDAVSAALRDLDTVNLSELPRMGDFAVWVTAAGEALPMPPGAFLAAYTGNRQNAEENLR